MISVIRLDMGFSLEEFNFIWISGITIIEKTLV